MKTKTNRTLRKILSIALCLALVMSYVPMVSITASAAATDITVYKNRALAEKSAGVLFLATSRRLPATSVVAITLFFLICCINDIKIKNRKILYLL